MNPGSAPRLDTLRGPQRARGGPAHAPAPDAWPAWACPDHHLLLEDRGASLWCPRSHEFPRIKGIPRFVHGPNYADAFGLQWWTYRRTQLDSYTGLPISADRARRCLGEALWSDLAGKHVLEAGCGAGRFTEVLRSRGARVTSVDLSGGAAEANEVNFPSGPDHRVAQADLLRLPFLARRFDVVFCLGVVQHTPDPEATITALYEQVRPGGHLVFDHYTYNLSWYTKTAPLFRAVLRRMPPERGLRATEALVKRLFPLHRAVRKHRALQILVSRFSPVLVYYHALPELSDEQQREWALLDTHDSLTDWYEHFRTPRSIRRTLEALGLEDIACGKGGNGVEARGRRPA